MQRPHSALGGTATPSSSVSSLRLETSQHDHVTRGLPLQEEHSPGELHSLQSTSLQTVEAMSQSPEGEPLGSTSRSPAGQPVKSSRLQAIAALLTSLHPAGEYTPLGGGELTRTDRLGPCTLKEWQPCSLQNVLNVE